MVTVLPPPPPKQSKGFLNSLLQGAAYAVGPAVENYQNSKKQSAAEEQKFQREMQKLQMQYDLDRRNKLEQLSGQKEKPLNELQQAQADLARQKTDYYKSESDRLNKITGDFGNEDESFSNKIMREPAKASQDLDLSDDEYDQFSNAKQEKQKPKENPNDMRTWSKERLNRARALKGSKNARASEIGTQAENTFQEMEQEKKERLESTRYQSKEVSQSFKENQDFINSNFDKYEDAQRREAILSRMDELISSGELSDSGMINALESLGLKPEWLKNPANEEYNKLSLDLLGGGTLQADYGSRVLASEFNVSQQRIPTLSQTDEGKKQIAENIKTMLLPSILKNERLQYYLDKQERTGEPLPHNLRGKILKDIKPQLDEAYDKFKQRNGRYPVKTGTVPDDNAIEKYYYLSGGNDVKAIKMMKEDGYVTD